MSVVVVVVGRKDSTICSAVFFGKDWKRPTIADASLSNIAK
jgi:hypothetical protein